MFVLIFLTECKKNIQLSWVTVNLKVIKLPGFVQVHVIILYKLLDEFVELPVTFIWSFLLN